MPTRMSYRLAVLLANTPPLDMIHWGSCSVAFRRERRSSLIILHDEFVHKPSQHIWWSSADPLRPPLLLLMGWNPPQAEDVCHQLRAQRYIVAIKEASKRHVRDFEAKCQASCSNYIVFSLLFLLFFLSPIDVTRCVHVISFENTINKSDNFVHTFVAFWYGMNV